MRAVRVELDSGDVCFGLTLKHLHPDRQIDAESVTRDAVAFITALEGQTDARFVLQTVAYPVTERPEQGRLTIHLLVAISPPADDHRVDELCDDLLDLLASPPVRWTFEPITTADELEAVLSPLAPAHLAEVARREEPCLPTAWEGGVGFGARPEDRRADRSLWSMWTLGPASLDLRRLGSVLLAQEAPVCIRVSLTPSEITVQERSSIEDLARTLGGDLPIEGLLRASMHTIESLLYVRPLFDVRCVVASPDPLSRSMLSALGHSISEPTTQGTPDPVLRGGFAAIRGETDVDAATLLGAYETLSCGDPIPSLAPAGLERLRRLLGPWEAANIFRIPATDEDGFPGVETLRVPDLEVPLADLATSGHDLGHLVGDVRHRVLLDRNERFRHLYVSGQTGTGKSTLLLNLALHDIRAGAGVAVLDPHGDLVEAILRRIPEDRLDDVVIIDPADQVAVAGVNLLEAETPTQKEYMISELAAMFYALFDPNRTGIVGPRYETWLRQAALLLLANPDQPSSFLDIPTVFVDPAVRKRLLRGIEDPILAEFWFGEMAQTSDFHKSEVLGWFRSKFEVFRTSALVRNVVGQARSTVSFSEVMNDQKILLVNLSKGLLGEYNSALIGHIVFSRLWAAALERASIPASQRKDFFIYLDEFQNMTTDSLPAVLSEARKFRVAVTLANQFFSQVPELTRDALMGNVGSRITFRLGPKDAEPFAGWLGADVHPHDLTTLPNHLAVAALSAQGVPMDPFPFKTAPPSDGWSDQRAADARDRSRKQFGVPTESLDPSFFSRWAHVAGSASAMLFAPSAPASDPSPVIGDSIPEPTFIERWVLDRILATTNDDPVSVRFVTRPEQNLIKCVGLLRRRFDLSVEDAVRLASATDGSAIEGVQRSHAAALRFELRLLGAEVAIDPPDQDGAGLSPARSDAATLTLEDLNLTRRVLTSLRSAGISSVSDLTAQTPSGLLSIDRVGARTLADIESALALRGLFLRPAPGSTASATLDESWLLSVGYAGLNESDRRALLDAAATELGRRASDATAACMSDPDYEVLRAARAIDDELSTAVLDEAVPDRMAIEHAELKRLRAEIESSYAMIMRELSADRGTTRSS